MMQEKNKFIAERIKELYEDERRRGEAIHQQSERLPVFQTLFFTVLYSVFPSLFGDSTIRNWLIWIFVITVTIIGAVSLIFTLLAQWRFPSENVITVEEVVNFAEEFYRKNDDQKTAFDIETNYVNEKYKQYCSEQVKDNKRRGNLLSVAMWLFAAILALSVVFTAAMCVWR